MEFNEDDPEDNSIEEICNTLDPNGTGFIQYDALYKQWTEQAEDEEEVDLDEQQEDDMEEHFASLNNLDNKFSNGDDSEQRTEPEYRMSLIQSMRESNYEASFKIGAEQLL